MGEEKDYGDPIVGAMLGLCVGYYLGRGVTPFEIGALAREQAELIDKGLGRCIQTGRPGQ